MAFFPFCSILAPNVCSKISNKIKGSSSLSGCTASVLSPKAKTYHNFTLHHVLPSDFRIIILRRLSILFASSFVREIVGEIYTEILWICAQNSLISLSRYRRYCSSWKFNLLNLFGNSNMIRFYIKWKLEKKKFYISNSH